MLALLSDVVAMIRFGAHQVVYYSAPSVNKGKVCVLLEDLGKFSSLTKICYLILQKDCDCFSWKSPIVFVLVQHMGLQVGIIWNLKGYRVLLTMLRSSCCLLWTASEGKVDFGVVQLLI